MNDNADLTAKINIVPGEDSGAKLLDDFNQRVAGMRQRVEALDQGFVDLGRFKLDNLKNAFESRPVDMLNKEVKDLREELLRTGKEADKTAKSLSDMAKTRDEINKLDEELEQLDADAAPDRQSAGTGLRQFGRELRNLPSMQIPGLGIGTDAIANITRMTGSLVDLSEKSAIAAAAADLLTPALGAQAAATAAAYAPIGLLVAGATAVVAAFAAVTDGLRQAREEAQANIEFQTQQAGFEAEINRLRRDGDLKGLQDRQKQIGDEIALEEDKKRRFEELRDATQKAIDDAPPFTVDLNALYNQLSEYEAAINGIDTGRLSTLRQEYNTFATAAMDASFNAQVALEDLIKKEKELTTQRQDSIDKIQSLNDQETDLNTKFNNQQIQQLVDRARQSARVDADYKTRDLRSEEDHNRQLLKLDKDYQGQITKIRADGDKQIADVVKNLAKQEEAAAEKRTDALDDFNEKVADAESKYRKQAEKDAIEFGRRRQEIENDFQRNTSEARLDFDVRAFKDAQDEQKRDLADLKTDRKDAKNERLDDLKEEEAQAAENHEEKLKQIDEELTKAREQTAERITQIEAQEKEALESAATLHQERLDDDAESRRITRERELEDRARTAARQKEDTEITLARQQAVHDAQIQHLNDLEIKELAIYYERDAQLTALLDKEKQLTKEVGGTSTGTTNNPFEGAKGTISGYNSDVDYAPTADEYLPLPPPPPPGGVGDQFMNPNSLTGSSRRSPLANPAAFASGSGSGGGRSGGLTVQIVVTGNNFGKITTPEDVDAMAAKLNEKIDLSQIETVAGVQMSMRQAKRPVRS